MIRLGKVICVFYVMFFGVLVVEEGGCSFLALGKTNKRRKGTREEGKLFPSEAIFGLEEAVYLLIRARGFSRNLPLAQQANRSSTIWHVNFAHQTTNQGCN
jgi:hypothetical protein